MKAAIPLRRLGTGVEGTLNADPAKPSWFRCIMKAAREDSDVAFPPGSPWWAPLLIRHGVTALIAMWALWMLGKQLEAYPTKIELLADRLTRAIQLASESQIRANEALEIRITERTRNAVRDIINEVQKGK